MKIRQMGIVALMAAMPLGGCVNSGLGGPNQTGATIGGAALGGVIGSAVSHGSAGGAILGAVVGGLAGSAIGRQLDQRDQAIAMQRQQMAFNGPVGQTVVWNNPDSGHSGSYTVTRDGRDAGSGEYCRQFTQTINVGGQQQTGYGTACQAPDGQWRIVSGS